jgi:hypothetical protein
VEGCHQPHADPSNFDLKFMESTEGTQSQGSSWGSSISMKVPAILHEPCTFTHARNFVIELREVQGTQPGLRPCTPPLRGAAPPENRVVFKAVSPVEWGHVIQSNFDLKFIEVQGAHRVHPSPLYFHTCEEFCYRIEGGPGDTAGAPPLHPAAPRGPALLTRVNIQEPQKIPLHFLKQVWIWFEIGTPTEKGHIKLQKTPGRLFFLDEL